MVKTGLVKLAAGVFAAQGVQLFFAPGHAYLALRAWKMKPRVLSSSCAAKMAVTPAGS